MSLLRRGRVWDYAFDWAALGVATATAVVGGERSKTNLAIASTFLGGAEAIIGKNAPAASAAIVIQQMNTDRDIQREKIMRSLEKKEIDEYPMAAAISDVQRYYNLGTVDIAVARVLSTTALGNALREAAAGSDEKLVKMLKALTSNDNEEVD